MTPAWWDTTSSLSVGVPFAVDATGAWRDVSEVPRGKACGCFCAECRTPLIARQGEVNVHHFAHQDRRECRQALEASLFGMAVEILKQPGARLRLPPYYSIASLMPLTGASHLELSHVFGSLKLSPAESTVTLAAPAAAVAQTSSSKPSLPDLTDETVGLHVHLLSSVKPLRSIPKPGSGNVLAVNCMIFAHAWFRWVCDPDREVRLLKASRAKDEFASWLASSPDGRGWLSNTEERRAAELVKGAVAEHRAIIARNLPNLPTTPPARQFPARWPPIPTVKPKPPPPPMGPDVVVQTGAGVCQQCSSPCDVLLRGSGLFAGKRQLVCRANPRHPVQHIG